MACLVAAAAAAAAAAALKRRSAVTLYELTSVRQSLLSVYGVNDVSQAQHDVSNNVDELITMKITL